VTAGPAELQRALGDGAVTVTHLLEKLTGESIVADVVRQFPAEAGSGDDLGVPEGQALTGRIAVLRGRATGLAYVYAESTFLPERLPAPARERLARTSDPIGRVLADQGLAMEREALGWPDADVVPSLPPGPADPEIVWRRAYRLTVDGRPVFSIREWFFRSVLDALDRRAAD
jgi:chorismate-pyruvate lyase